MNFYAVLYGDVTGNWAPSSGFQAFGVAASAEERTAIAADLVSAKRFERGAGTAMPARRCREPGRVFPLTVGRRPCRPEAVASLTVELSNAEQILGLDLTLRYDRVAVRHHGGRSPRESEPVLPWPTASARGSAGLRRTASIRCRAPGPCCRSPWKRWHPQDPRRL